MSAFGNRPLRLRAGNGGGVRGGQGGACGGGHATVLLWHSQAMQTMRRKLLEDAGAAIPGTAVAPLSRRLHEQRRRKLAGIGASCCSISKVNHCRRKLTLLSVPSGGRRKLTPGNMSVGACCVSPAQEFLVDRVASLQLA